MTDRHLLYDFCGTSETPVDNLLITFKVREVSENGVFRSLKTICYNGMV